MYEIAIDILKKINNMGYKAYIVGGYPRDVLLGISSNDIDICTNMSLEMIKNKFNVVEDNSKFGNLKIKINNYIFEITIFRIDLDYNKGYPKIISTNSLKKDLKRRDFTINAICIDKNEKYIDKLRGIKDLKKRKIKCIGNADKKIKEDPVRILRAIRIMGKFNFRLDKKLESSIIENRYLLKEISKKRIKSELEKMNKTSLNIIKKFSLEEFL